MTVRSALTRPSPQGVPAERDRELHVRWLGRVRYQDALAVQHQLFAGSDEDHLLLLEHPHVFTLGARGDTSNILGDPAADRRRGRHRRPRWRRHVPRPWPAGRLSDPDGARSAWRRHGRHRPLRPRRGAAVDRRTGRARASRLWPPRRLPGCLGRSRGVGATQDRGHRRPAVPRPVDARLRAQRRSRHGVLRRHRALRHHRQGGHVATWSRGIEVSMREVTDVVARLAVERWGSPAGSTRADVAGVSVPTISAPSPEVRARVTSPRSATMAAAAARAGGGRARPVARSPGRGRRGRRHAHHRTQTRVDAGQGRHGPRVPAPQERHA